MQFRNVFADGEPDRPRTGDRLIYDRRNGTLSVYRLDADLSFSTDTHRTPAPHIFVGHDWGRDLTEATAALYGRLGNLDGAVRRIEGSFVTLETWEVVS